MMRLKGTKHGCARIGAFVLLSCMSLLATAQENCANALDDDGDGLIDLNDSLDCACASTMNTENGIESFIANPSFEDHHLLPNYFSQLGYAQTWYQATLATTDYYHTDSWVLPGTPLPPPDGRGFTGLLIEVLTDGVTPPDSSLQNYAPYYEYLGANTIEPLQANVEYSIELDLACMRICTTEGCSDIPALIAPDSLGPIDFTLFGSPSTTNFPVALAPLQNGCPLQAAGWVELGHVSYQGTPEWSTVRITFTPGSEIRSVMMGAPCAVPFDHWKVRLDGLGYYPYYFVDNLVLNKTELFDYGITATGNLCTGLVLQTQAPAGVTGYQWYHDGIALVGRTSPTLNVNAAGQGPGTYQVVVQHNGGCVQLVYTVPDLGASLSATASPLVVSPGQPVELHAAGAPSYQWTPAGAVDCASCDTTTASPESTTVYCVTAAVGAACDTACVKVEVVVPCPGIFIPSAFSPNASGKNDTQCLYGGACIASMTFGIYDRWGTKVFEATDTKACWDGKYNGQDLDPAVFVYRLSATLTNGETVEKQGNITLVR